MAYDGYSWIKVPKYEMNESLSWEERYKQLEDHHIKETQFLIDELRSQDIVVPKEVTRQMENYERVVGYMKTLFDDEIFFTKKGCSSKDGCNNFIYHSDEGYKKQSVVELSPSDLNIRERHFVQSFLWN